MGYVDVELALVSYLEDLGYCDTWTPADMEQIVTGATDNPPQPVHRIKRVGGPSDKDSGEDFPSVDILTFALKSAAAPRAAYEAATAVRERMEALSGHYVPGQGLLDSAECRSGPTELVWVNPAIAVFQTIYAVTTRGA